MPRYLITGSYTAEGTKGLLVEGGSGRKAVIDKACKKAVSFRPAGAAGV